MTSCDTVASRGFIVYAERAATKDHVYLPGSLQWVPVGANNAYQTVLVPGLASPVGLEFYHIDDVNGYIFWSDNHDDYIGRVSFDGSSLVTIIHNVKSDSLAVDWISGNLYWIDYQLIPDREQSQNSKLVNFTVSVSRLDGRYQKKLITSGLSDPKGIAVLPKQGYVATSNS